MRRRELSWSFIFQQEVPSGSTAYLKALSVSATWPVGIPSEHLIAVVEMASGRCDLGRVRAGCWSPSRRNSLVLSGIPGRSFRARMMQVNHDAASATGTAANGYENCPDTNSNDEYAYASRVAGILNGRSVPRVEYEPNRGARMLKSFRQTAPLERLLPNCQVDAVRLNETGSFP